ncbi:MAG: hypothetical protein ACP5RT_00265 [Candidatus Micrarchaeia archaeon]
MLELEVIALTLLAAFLTSIAQIIFKKNLPHFKASLLDALGLLKIKKILLGIIIYIVSLPIYLFALKGGNLSFVYPTFASSFIFVFLLSKFLLGEKVKAIRVFGIALILIGIVIIALTF